MIVETSPQYFELEVAYKLLKLHNAIEESNSSQHTKQTWRFRREQAQADINRLLGYLKKYEDVYIYKIPNQIPSKM